LTCLHQKILVKPRAASPTAPKAGTSRVLARAPDPGAIRRLRDGSSAGPAHDGPPGQYRCGSEVRDIRQLQQARPLEPLVGWRHANPASHLWTARARTMAQARSPHRNQSLGMCVRMRPGVDNEMLGVTGGGSIGGLPRACRLADGRSSIARARGNTTPTPNCLAGSLPNKRGRRC
jgi:hypothetical protein